MLDMKRTFDDLVERFAESPQARDRILANPIYQPRLGRAGGQRRVLGDGEGLRALAVGPLRHCWSSTHRRRSTRSTSSMRPERLLEFLDSRLVQLLDPPGDGGRSRRLPLVPARSAPRARADRAHQRHRVPRGRLRVPDGVRAHVRGLSQRARTKCARSCAGPIGLRAGGQPGERVGGAGAALSRAPRGRAALSARGHRRQPRPRLAATRDSAHGEPPPPREPDPAELDALARALATQERPGFPAERAARAAVDAAARLRCARSPRRTSAGRAARASGAAGRFLRAVPEFARGRARPDRPGAGRLGARRGRRDADVGSQRGQRSARRRVVAPRAEVRPRARLASSRKRHWPTRSRARGATRAMRWRKRSQPCARCSTRRRSPARVPRRARTRYSRRRRLDPPRQRGAWRRPAHWRTTLGGALADGAGCGDRALGAARAASTTTRAPCCGPSSGCASSSGSSACAAARAARRRPALLRPLRRARPRAPRRSASRVRA